VSIRGQVGAGWFDIEERHFTGTVKPIFFDGNVVYNWEHGTWHPYVTAGLGAYTFHSSESGAVDDSDTNLGADLGAGIEKNNGD